MRFKRNLFHYLLLLVQGSEPSILAQLFISPGYMIVLVLDSFYEDASPHQH